MKTPAAMLTIDEHFNAGYEKGRKINQTSVKNILQEVYTSDGWYRKYTSFKKISSLQRSINIETNRFL